ncbi:hypothetical protein GE21DRAFT_9133 [Neurospora crassa]|uniref:DUF7820 domain-containing protein n=1 Tax=Neurospora crassa (strain ATCC 24698 / 74-OR23-1A / CBS 708.71 / DSM 1257 / FGSC 987) TaxID=367110 RepID=Q1K5Z6_NEUCR|nr:hypothetical protein NCU03915 [Neurospora crassa OR74A]EAA28318.2 hypothetical protein NCU03915 [Neurospora crassa OR74A]KHE80077.1 hypothetical protein GE21DRAFT_9133 [Neurospora crassa]|eukprot:XP_957554.2 hypothetical protein NCU03915 [Neurospora crassa OR74A]
MDPSDSKLGLPERRRSRRTSVRHSLTLRTERMDEFPHPEDPALASVADHDMRRSLPHDPSPAVVALGQELGDEGVGQGGRQSRARITTTSPTSTPILPGQPFSQAELRPASESSSEANAGMAATSPLSALTTFSPELPQAPFRPPSPTKPASSAADPLALRHDGATSPNLSSQHMGIDAAHSASVHGPIQPSGPSHVYEQYTRNLPFGPPLGLSSDPLPRTYPYHGPSDPSPYHIYPQDVHNAPQYGRVVTQQGEVPVVDYYGPYGHHEPLPPYTERDNTGLGGSSSNSVGPSPAPVADSAPSTGPPIAFTAVASSSAPASAPASSPALGPDPVEEVSEGRTIPTAQPTQAPLPSTQTLPITQASPTTQTAATAQTGQTEETGPAAQSGQAEVLTGAGGLGLATRNPEFDSLDDLRAPRPRVSTRSFNSTHSNDQIEREKAVLSEKETPFKRWMRKQWCFGVVPNWALVLSLCLLVIVGIVAGTVAGVLLSNHGKPPPKESHPKPSSGTTFPSNVVPIPTPTDLAPLPTGTWGIPMMLDKASSNCFKDPTQSKSWDCHFVPSGMYLSLEHSAQNGYTFTINCNHSLTMFNNVYSYGEQPALLVNPRALVLVNDTSEVNRGPAWFQAVPYMKTVILPHDSLNITTTGTAKMRRGWGSKDYNKSKGNEAQPGDKPWICNWPQTTFELFIFAQQNSSWSVNTQSLPPPSATSSVPASTDSTTMTVVVTKTETDHVVSPTASPFPSSTWPPDGYNHYITKSLGQHLRDGDVDYHPHRHRQFEADHHGQESFSSDTPSSTSGPAPSFASGLLGTGPRGDGFAPPPPGYPRVIKLEERRYSDAPIPECTQFEILPNGQAAQPVRDENGDMVVVTMYPPEATETSSPRSSRRSDKRFTDWDLDFDEEDDSPIWSPEVLRRGGGDGGLSYANDGSVSYGSQCNCEWFVT